MTSIRDFRSRRVAVVGSAKWPDENPVRVAVKSLAAGTMVLVDDEPCAATSAAIRQCRCSNLVSVQFRQPGLGRDVVAARADRDAAMFQLADSLLIFGELAPDRAATLEQFEAAGLEVVRYGRESYGDEG